MFESVGWGEILVLIIAGLFILGPERLPEAASWLAKSVRKVRDFATGAKEQLREEMGPEFDQLRKPLEDLRGLRNFDPKRVCSCVQRHVNGVGRARFTLSDRGQSEGPVARAVPLNSIVRGYSP